MISHGSIPECRYLRSETLRLLKVFRKYKNCETLKSYIASRKAYNDLLRTKKSLYNESVRDKLLLNINNAKVFWSTLKKNSSPKTRKQEIQIEDWYSHFKDLFQNSEMNDFIEIQEDNHNTDELTAGILDSPITADEIYDAINKLKNSKAPGEDNLIPEFF